MVAVPAQFIPAAPAMVAPAWAPFGWAMVAACALWALVAVL